MSGLVITGVLTIVNVTAFDVPPPGLGFTTVIEAVPAAAMRAAGLAVELDLFNHKINAKVREHSLAHVPVLAVVGRKEAEQRAVALRRLGGEAQEVLTLDEAVSRLAAEAAPPDLKSQAVQGRRATEFA